MTSRIPGAVDEPLSANVAPAFNTGHSTGIEALEELGVHNVSNEKSPAMAKEALEDEIRPVLSDEEAYGDGDKTKSAAEKVDNMEEIALYALHTDDDVSLNPWTFRTWFLGKNTAASWWSRLTFHRHWVIMLFGGACNDIPVQTSRHHPICNISLCYFLCFSSSTGIHPQVGNTW